MPARRRREPPAHLADRLSACRAKIHQKSLDGYLVTNRKDQFYLTGFAGEDGAALILPRTVYLLTDGRFKEEAAAAPWANAVIRDGPLHEAVARVVRRHRISRLGFQPEALTVAQHRLFGRTIRPARLTALPSAVGRLRLIKDPTEVKAVEEAIRVAEEAFNAVRRRIRIGMTERELAARLHHGMVSRGASDASFPIIVAEGPNAARPHATPGDRRFKAGSAVLVDWGATVDHYHSDLTRVLFIRRIPPRFRRIYEHVLAAQRAAIDAVRPGARMCDVDGRARKLLAGARLGRHFSHGLGHGLGLDVHEPPRVSTRVTDPLEPGMLITVEPGVYLSGFGGVRIEDDVLVTEDGARVLSTLTRDIDRMVV